MSEFIERKAEMAYGNREKPVIHMGLKPDEISIRDKFAMASIDAAYHHVRKTGQPTAKRIAERAYEIADELLKARCK